MNLWRDLDTEMFRLYSNLLFLGERVADLPKKGIFP